jgi:hypothetical protein
MKAQPTPLRFLPAWRPQFQDSPPRAERTEPVLDLKPIATLQESLAPRLRRDDIERALEEGSRRVYEPMAEAEVIERPRRR